MADSARLIMTGQAQHRASPGAVQDRGVREDPRPVRLRQGIKIDVQDLQPASPRSRTAKPINANGNLLTNFGYHAGRAGDIVVVRLMYEWPVYVSLLGFNLTDMAGNKRLIIATAAFRNEPFQ